MRPLEDLVADRPFPHGHGGKADRGTLMIIGGPAECPGGVLLAATAALRTGSGKVQLVVHPSVAPALAVAMPETLVAGWDLDGGPPDDVTNRLRRASAVIVGPGLTTDPGDAVDRIGALAQDARIVLDAGALPAIDRVASHPGVLIAPNEDEAASILGDDSDDSDPESSAVALAARLDRTVTVRGSTTVTAGATGEAWCHEGTEVLGTPGSGDVFVGVLGGLLARGVDAQEAQAWAVLAHAAAGRLLERSRGFGWLARDIADSLPDAVVSLRGS
jgi:ADP-dependent NAD(P)H-hydrate dehydratase